MATPEQHTKKELSLGLWEKYLTLWIALCIVAGLLVGQVLSCFWAVHGFAEVCSVVYSYWDLVVLHDVSYSCRNTV